MPNVRTSSPVATSHMLAVLSALPVTRCRPSGVKATPRTQPLCPVSAMKPFFSHETPPAGVFPGPGGVTGGFGPSGVPVPGPVITGGGPTSGTAGAGLSACAALTSSSSSSSFLLTSLDSTVGLKALRAT